MNIYHKQTLFEKLINSQLNRKLTDIEVDLIHNVMYDGSDAYESVEESIDSLPKIYDAQIEVLNTIL